MFKINSPACTLLLVLTVSFAFCGCDQQARSKAAAMTGGDPDRGKVAMRDLGCSSCHTIPGVPGASAQVGPPLVQMANRGYIGGVLKNTPENMIRWLENPPGVDPLTAMPNLRVSEAEARDLASYLYTLK